MLVLTLHQVGVCITGGGLSCSFQRRQLDTHIGIGIPACRPLPCVQKSFELDHQKYKEHTHAHKNCYHMTDGKVVQRQQM